MSDNHQTRRSGARHAWLGIFVSFLLQALHSYVFYPILQIAFPQVSAYALWYISIIPIDLIPIIYLSVKIGPMGISDLLLKRSDFIVMFIAIMILVIFFSIISLTFRIESEIYREIGRLSGFEYLITLFIIFLIGPFLEETFFRKYIYEIFRSNYGTLRAISITAFIETLVHIGYWDIKFLVMIFMFMVFLTVVYSKSRLGTSILVHSVISIFLGFF